MVADTLGAVLSPWLLLFPVCLEPQSQEEGHDGEGLHLDLLLKGRPCRDAATRSLPAKASGTEPQPAHPSPLPGPGSPPPEIPPW